MCSNVFCSNLLLLAAVLTEVNFIEFGADIGLTLQQTLPESNQRKDFLLLLLYDFFFFNLAGFLSQMSGFFCTVYMTASVSCMFTLCMKRLLEGEGFLQYSLKVVKVWIYLLISTSLFERWIPSTQILHSLFSFFILALCQDKQSSLF